MRGLTSRSGPSAQLGSSTLPRLVVLPTCVHVLCESLLFIFVYIYIYIYICIDALCASIAHTATCTLHDLHKYNVCNTFIMVQQFSSHRFHSNYLGNTVICLDHISNNNYVRWDSICLRVSGVSFVSEINICYVMNAGISSFGMISTRNKTNKAWPDLCFS